MSEGEIVCGLHKQVLCRAHISYYDPNLAPIPDTIEEPWQGPDTLPGRPALRAHLKYIEQGLGYVINEVLVLEEGDLWGEFRPIAGSYYNVG